MKSYGLVVLSPFAIHRKSVRKLPFTTIQGRHVFFIRRYVVGRQQLDAKVNGVAHLIMMRKSSLGLYFIIIIISHLKNSLEVSVLPHPLLFHSHIHPPWLRKILVRQHAGRKAKSSNLWPSIDVDDDERRMMISFALSASRLRRSPPTTVVFSSIRGFNLKEAALPIRRR